MRSEGKSGVSRVQVGGAPTLPITGERKKERKKERRKKKKRSTEPGINYAPDSCSQKPVFVRICVFLLPPSDNQNSPIIIGFIIIVRGYNCL